MRILLAIALFDILAFSCSRAGIAELQIEPEPSDNFQFAEFRLWMPVTSHPNRLIVLTLGANEFGLQLAKDPSWQAMADSLHFGLLCCFYSPSPAPSRWDMASEGTGRALLQSLDYFSKATNNPQLKSARLFLMGDSAGGVFSYHFAAWHPDRTIGFVSLKGGNHEKELAGNAVSLPGLFVMGELDMPSRLINMKTTFLHGRSMGAPWCLAVEPHSRHEADSCVPLGVAFLQSLFATQASMPPPTLNALRQENADSIAQYPVSTDSWFPSSLFKRNWKAFQQGQVNNELSKLSFHSQPPPKLAIASPDAIRLESISSSEESKIATLRVISAKPGAWNNLNILPPDYLRDVTISKISKGEQMVSFWVDAQNMPLGQFSGRLPIRFMLDNKPVLGGIDIPIAALIAGDLVPSPPSIYLGQIAAGTKITAEIKIVSKSGMPIHLLSCEKPDKVKVEAPNKPSNPLRITVSFEFSENAVTSGIIMLHLLSNKEWALKVPYIASH